MATRLHPDDGKGQSTWADIDDDDDDWAPETITWQDGTKIALPHVEEQSSVSPPSTYPPPSAAKDEKPKSPAPNVHPSPSPKPGLLASGKGLVLKGAPEKPTLVAKPPAPPAPVKSPWAQIPRVDQASPVIPPSQQGGAKYPGVDGGLGPKSMTPPPPKEIAADDFNRATWRDNHGPPGNRELFNSQNGRYEPVTDRRASMRSDQHSRQPALLQRGAPSEHKGPAEPSAAFQTSRVSEQVGPYGRRRGSSNVSGGSGSFLRPKGPDQALPPTELLSTRRESFAASDSPVSPTNFSMSSAHHGGPRQPNNQAWPPRASPVAAHVTPHHAGPAPDGQGAAAASELDIIAEQKRLMHERRELAKKRRLEEEAREEAAKKERIRLKLEAMGPAPESRSARMAASKDEVPSASKNEPAKTATADEAKGPEAPASISKPEGKPDTATNNGVLSPPQQQPVTSREPTEGRGHPQGTPAAHTWPNTTGQTERYPSWSVQGSVKNVWAPQNSDRSLGNGTFSSDLGRGSEPAQIPPIPGKPGPGPIAPPHSSRGAAKPQTNAPTTTPTRQPPIGPPTQAARRDVDATKRNLLQNAWVSGVRDSDAATAKELRERQEEDIRRLGAEGRTLADVQAPIQDEWRPTRIGPDGRRIVEGSKQRAVQYPRTGTWGASAEGSAATAQKPPAENAPTQAQASNQRPQGGIAPSDTSAASMLAPGGPGAPQQQPRGSRFFPSRDIRYEAGAGTGSQRQSSPSPPPPDMDGHPAFDGDVARPQVSLPRPQPVVRLPPAAEGGSGPAGQRGEGRPNFDWAVPKAYQNDGARPVARTTPAAPRGPATAQGSNWQDKFDSLLLGRNGPSPPKSLAVDSASRHSLEHHRYRSTTTTISLPSPLTSIPSTLDRDGSVTSKCMAEECFEEQEMGSLPPVRLPNKVPETAWQPYPAPKPLPKKLGAIVVSSEALAFPNEIAGSGSVLRVFIPGMAETKTFTIPFSRTRSNPRRAPRGGRHSSQAHRSGKQRDSSSSYSNDQGASSSGPPPSRGGRSGFRGRDNWSRNSSNAVQT